VHRVIGYHLHVTTLVVPEHREEDDLEGLRARADQLEATLADRAAALEGLRADLQAFSLRYRQEVGLLHDQLDELELAIAEAELGELSRRLEDRVEGGPAPPPTARPEPQARYTSDAVRKLFRDVAKTIHPDLARDESTRSRRHTLMVEATRAYTLGDEQQLRWILQAWQRSPEAVPGTDPEATRLRLERRIAQVEDELATLATDMAALEDSPLGKLKAMVDEAAGRGKDIVRDMVARLKRDIMAATNRLDAMRPPS
jgi:hypothetical protein